MRKRKDMKRHVMWRLWVSEEMKEVEDLNKSEKDQERSLKGERAKSRRRGRSRGVIRTLAHSLFDYTQSHTYIT